MATIRVRFHSQLSSTDIVQTYETVVDDTTNADSVVLISEENRVDRSVQHDCARKTTARYIPAQQPNDANDAHADVRDDDDSQYADTDMAFELFNNMDEQYQPLLLPSPRSPTTLRSPRRPVVNRFIDIVNLTNTIVGSSMLSIPYAMGKAGWVLGTLLLLVAAVITWYTLRLLIFVAAHKPGQEASFSVCARMTYPKLVGVLRGLQCALFDIAVIITCLGIQTSYLIALSDFMPLFLKGVLQLLHFDEEAISSIWFEQWPWLTAAVVLLIPLSISNELNSLTLISSTALTAACYTVLVIVSFYFGVPSKPSIPTLPTIQFSTDLFTIIPIFIFSFCCHPNIFLIYNELRVSSAHQVNNIIITSVAISFVTYTSVGLAGYFAFGPLIQHDVFLNYDTGVWSTIARLALGIMVFLSGPLYHYPCRIAAESLVKDVKALIAGSGSWIGNGYGWHLGFADMGDDRNVQFSRFVDTRYVTDDCVGSHRPQTTPSTQFLTVPSASTSFIPPEQPTFNETSPAVSEVTIEEDIASTGRATLTPQILSLGILAVVWGVGISVKRLDTILALIGGTGSTIFVFILPSLFFYKLSSNRRGLGLQRFICILLVLIGVAIGVACILTSSGLI